MSPAVFAICMVLVLTLVFGLSGAGIYQERLGACNTNKNPWCYQDWKCLDANGNPVVKNSVASIIDNCSPITAERAAALNAAGHQNIYPGSNYPACVPPNSISTCPAYKVGDIDWTTCTPAKGYVSL